MAAEHVAPEIVVRAARPEEYDAVAELTVAAYHADALSDDYYDTRLRAVAERAMDAEVLVAVDDGGRVLGTVTYVGDGGAYGEIAGPDEAEFRMLAVDPEARGRGAGEALVRAVLARARAAGRRGVVLSSQPAMRAAHRLYARLGFVRTPERDWSPIPDFVLHTFAIEL